MDNNVSINEDELNDVVKQAFDSPSTFTVSFKKPLLYNGQEIYTIEFDLDNLTGADAIEMEREIFAQTRQQVVAPSFSNEYIIRAAARASRPRIGIDAFKSMGIGDYNKIRNQVRNFLFISES